MDFGFDTIGNATVICYDRVPVLVTDPWVRGSAYFGSWSHAHEIPEEQMEAIEASRYVWFSHGHPDHLNADSLDLFQDKQILLPDHVGQRMRRELEEEGRIELDGTPVLHSIFHNSHVSPRDHVAVYVVRNYRQDRLPEPNREIVACGFFDPADLPDDTTPGTRLRIAEVLEGKPPPATWR